MNATGIPCHRLLASEERNGVFPVSDCAAVATYSSPDTTLAIAKVAMNALSLTFATSSPLTVPVTSPTASPTRMARVVPWLSETHAAAVEDVAPTAPTDRSKPPTIIMTAIPQATMPMIAFCWRTFSRLIGCRKVGDAIISTATTMTRTAHRPNRRITPDDRAPAPGRRSALLVKLAGTCGKGIRAICGCSLAYGLSGRPAPVTAVSGALGSRLLDRSASQVGAASRATGPLGALSRQAPGRHVADNPGSALTRRRSI